MLSRTTLSNRGREGEREREREREREGREGGRERGGGRETAFTSLFFYRQEINYLIELADTNKDGILDYQEFTERFHQPSHNLGTIPSLTYLL